MRRLARLALVAMACVPRVAVAGDLVELAGADKARACDRARDLLLERFVACHTMTVAACFAERWTQAKPQVSAGIEVEAHNIFGTMIVGSFNVEWDEASGQLTHITIFDAASRTMLRNPMEDFDRRLMRL